jgi:hypothetical protein
MMRRDGSADVTLHAIAASFDTADAVLDAVRRARRDGYTRLDAHTPFPIDGMADALGYQERVLPWVAGVSGAAATVFGLWVLWYVDVVLYPIPVGGRALASWPAYALPVFEFMMLSTSIAAVLTMLVRNRLPRLNHPLFELDEFARASSDRFFVVILADDPLFDRERTGAFLAALGACTVDEVEA